MLCLRDNVTQAAGYQVPFWSDNGSISRIVLLLEGTKFIMSALNSINPTQLFNMRHSFLTDPIYSYQTLHSRSHSKISLLDGTFSPART